MSDGEIQAAPQKQRSTLEKIVVWGGILLLLCVVAVEFFAQKNYNAACAWLDENGLSNPTLADFRSNMTSAMESEVENGNSAVDKSTDRDLVFKWFSFFKEYKVTATATGEGDSTIVTTYFLGDLPEVAKPTLPKNPSATPPLDAFQGSGGGPRRSLTDNDSKGRGRPAMDDDEDSGASGDDSKEDGDTKEDGETKEEGDTKEDGDASDDSEGDDDK